MNHCEKCERHIFGYPDYGYWCKNSACECHTPESPAQEKCQGECHPWALTQQVGDYNSEIFECICPCHETKKPLTEEWEKEFDREFPKYAGYATFDSNTDRKRIKSFIRNLLEPKTERERHAGAAAERARIKKLIEGLQNEKMFGENIQWDDGWKAALAACLFALENEE